MTQRLTAPSSTPREKSSVEQHQPARDVGQGSRGAGTAGCSDAGLTARIAAVERLIALDDEVGDPEQLEDEILQGAIGDGEGGGAHRPPASGGRAS